MTETEKRLPANKIAHSFSRRKMYEECPRLYYETHVAKSLPFESNQYSDLGNAVHAHLHEALQKGVTILHPDKIKAICAKEMQDFNPALVEGIIRAYGYVLSETGIKISEQDWALRMDKDKGTFVPCPWFAKKHEVFDRAQADVCVINDNVASIHDYKTGKAKNVHQSQLEDMALHVFFRFPHIKKVKSQFHCMQENAKNSRIIREYERKSPEIRARVVRWVEIDKEIRKRNEDQDWEENPGAGCRWCDATTCGSHPSNAY